MQTFNIKDTYIDKDDPWLGILVYALFAVLSTKNRVRGYILGQLVLGRDMILRIPHKVDLKLICHKKQTQINKDNIHENSIRVEHNYMVG